MLYGEYQVDSDDEYFLGSEEIVARPIVQVGERSHYVGNKDKRVLVSNDTFLASQVVVGKEERRREGGREGARDGR